MPFSQEQADRICASIQNGQTLRQVAESEGISDSLIIWNARHSDEFSKQYARALDIRTERDFEGLEHDVTENPRLTDDGRVDNGWVQWKRVQIDTRKWALSKRCPKRYGDKVQQEISGPDGAPLPAIQVSFVKPPESTS